MINVMFADDKINREVNALVRLLDDPDEKIFVQVENKLISFGKELIPVLENTWEHTFDPIIQCKLEDIIHKISLNHVTAGLEQWALHEQENLLKGYLLVTQYQYPEIDEKKITDRLDKIFNDIWLELNNNLTSLEKIKVVNHIFYEVYKFKPNINSSDHLHDFYLNNLLESSKGNHLSMGILYLIIASKLKIPLYGVDLPDHFILAYTRQPVQNFSEFSEDLNNVLFYLNPNKKGIVFSENEINFYLKQLKLPANNSYIYPCGNKTIIKRLLVELNSQYKKTAEEDKVNDVDKMLKVLDVC